MSVSKLEAAARVVDCAVRQLFRYEDPLAIQLLAASAYRVLRDLADNAESVHIREEEKKFIAPGEEKAYYGALMEISNFLKHADKDPDGILEEFEERRNDIDLLSCTLYLNAFGLSLSAERMAMLQWTAIVYPAFFKPDAPFTRSSMAERYHELHQASRGEQLRVGEELLALAREVFGGAA